MGNNAEVNSTATLITAVILSFVGAEIFLVLPMILAAAARDLALTEAQIGFPGDREHGGRRSELHALSVLGATRQIGGCARDLDW